MGKINILPDNLCNQIAAGEVIERPAAVVKELLENSIDAQSCKISVSLLQGGRKEIRVVDDGEGMNSDDALLALERHATSKIKTFADLQSIQSLGFRGEAIPSIAAVSRFELITRERDSVSGTKIFMEGGVLKDVRETGCQPGTTVMVRDLFYNLPARRKFLRSIETEVGHINDQFLRLSMAHPEVHFQLTHQGRLSYELTPTKNPSERAAQILGTDLTGRLQSFSHEKPPLRLTGLVGPPELQRNNYQSLFLYVNGRSVRDRALNRAILAAYDTLLPKGKFPVVVLFLDIASEFVDVNVHPTKREVRFHNLGQVMEEVRSTLREALGVLQQKRWQRQTAPTQEFIPSRRKERLEQNQIPLQLSHISSFDDSPPASPLPQNQPPPLFPREDPDSSLETASHFAHPLFSRLSVLGQLGNAYILLEAPDGLVMIDQHAAHERILFDRLSSISSEKAPAQRLMKPYVLDFMPKEALLLHRWMEDLKQIGFEIEPFGGESFVVHAVPALLGDYSPDALLRGFVETALEEEAKPQWNATAALSKTAACHSAIRAGQKLQREEIRQLLIQLDQTTMSATCPHGRPLWWKITYEDIRRLFHRS